MKCKNCGAKMNDKARVCPNCGASREGGYVLLTEDINPSNDYEYEEFVPATTSKRKNNKAGKIIVAIILLIAILGTAGFFGYKYYIAPKNKPELSFTSGYGVINGDQAVIYVNIKKEPQLEYIQGVQLYGFDKTKEQGDVVISTDYEYTKNIDGTFRTIFFDTSKFDIKKGQEYTYTFEMMFSFADDDNVYDYMQVVKFPGEITENASDFVFDHSMNDEDADAEESTTKAPEETTTEATTSVSTDFIKTGFWYTKPVTNGDTRLISAIQFADNGACTITHYVKKGNEKWQISNTNGKYEIKEGSVFVTDSEGKTESYAIKKDALEDLTARKYNSTENADDFFGI